MSRKQALLEESALKGEVMWKSKGGVGDGRQLQMSTATSQTTLQLGSQGGGKGTATVPGPENDAHPQTQRTHPPGAEQSKGTTAPSGHVAAHCQSTRREDAGVPRESERERESENRRAKARGARVGGR